MSKSKRVGIVVGDFFQAQGVNRVVDQFLINHEDFENNNIVITGVYDKNTYYSSLIDRNAQINSESTATIISKLKQSIIYKTRAGQITTIMIRQVLPGWSAYKNVADNEHNEDVIIFQDVYAAYFYLKNSHRKKVVFMTHMYEDPLLNLRMDYKKITHSSFERLLHEVFSYVFNQSDEVVAICDNAKKTIERQFNPQNVSVVYNSVNIDNYEGGVETSNNNVKFVMASHFTYVKGMDLLADALVDISKEHLPCEFHLFGDGELLERFRETIQREHVQDVYLYGQTAKPYRFYCDKDVFLSTSRLETMPMGIIEAMAFKLPILATNVGAVSEMVKDRENGFLIHPSAKEVADGIRLAIKSRTLLRAMGDRSYSIYTEKFNKSAWVNSFCRIINRVTNI